MTTPLASHAFFWLQQSRLKFLSSDMRANSLSNDKILEVTKFKAFADDKLNVPKMIISVFGKLENIEGKGKKMLVTSIFSFSHNVFKRLLSWGRSRSVLCIVNYLILLIAMDWNF